MTTEEANTPKTHAEEPQRAETLSINTKPTPNSTKEKGTIQECTCKHVPAKPLDLSGSDCNDHSDAEEIRPTRTRRRRPSYPRPISRSPSRGTMRLTSSKQLLEQVNAFDGLAEFPYPARQSTYVTTFPFTKQDVRKWSWLLHAGQEEVWMHETRGYGGGVLGAEEEDVGGGYYAYRRGRSRSPGFGGEDIPSVFLSRALDAEVVPMGGEEGGRKVRWLVVVRNRERRPASKLMVAYSRQAAGIIVFYEALCGNSVPFVGAVVDGPGARGRGAVKFKAVKSLDEAEAVAENEVGIIC